MDYVGSFDPLTDLTEYNPLRSSLLDGRTSEERKQYPVKAGFMDYFRDAIYRVAHHSMAGNRQHNADQPLHWSRHKSADHADCVARHLLASDDEEHLTALAWRAMAMLQLFLEKKYDIKPPPGAR